VADANDGPGQGRHMGSYRDRWIGSESTTEGTAMRTLAIINQKGGCGKTTTSINLAACMARLGHKTLLVDMDPQGHCGVGLAVPEEQIERTIYDALIEERDGKPARISEIVWQIASDFDLCPSDIHLAGFEQVFSGRQGREDRLLKALSQVGENYEWCVIDCPPSVGLLTFNALRAADEVIVPVETGFFSLHGLTKMMETLEVLREQCDKEVQVRVLPTQYDTRTKLAREVLSELRSKFRDKLMQSTINFNTKLKEAASFGQPITEYDPGSRGYKDFVNLARELMGNRPLEIEPEQQKLSRPAELVQRAKQLAQLTNVQFGRTSAMPVPQPQPMLQPAGGGGVAVAEPMRMAERLEIPQSPVLAEAAMEVEEKAAEAREMATEQKIREFYGVKQVGQEVIFAARFEEAASVSIAGDFNAWSASATRMEAGRRSGEWRTALPLKSGRYRYRLVVDGKWITDPNNQYVEVNQFGELNNIVEVE
jgi:chromosome partitioning protein